MTTRFLVSLFMLLAVGCTSYHGMGNYKTSSDYRGRAPAASRLAYTPHSPFHLTWPVTVVHINRGFHPKQNPQHEGMDLGGHKGVPIFAAHEGRVIYVGNEFHGYGNMVLLEYDHEWATLYAHLDAFSVREGQIVKAGDRLGQMGSTGHATGVHLHFEALHHRTPVDPLTLLSNLHASR